VKKRKGHLQVEIDPKIYAKLKKTAKERGKSVDDLTKEVFLKTVKTQKTRKK
jgi:predicted HicB family RNase H-like nuclease